MFLGLNLGLHASQGGGSSGYTFSDFTAQSNGAGTDAEIVDANTARTRRLNGTDRGALTIDLPAGTYRLRADLTQWAGEGTGAQLRLQTGFWLNAAVDLTVDSGLNNYFTAMPVDATFTFASPATLILACTSTPRSAELTIGADPLLEVL